VIRIAEVKRKRALVIGSGIAGLSTALGLGRCALLTRGKLGSGSSRYAQGGIAAALGPKDAAAAHAADTIAVAAGIADPLVAEAVTHAAAGRIEWLRALGAQFDADAEGRLRLGQEAGHSTRRIVHANGDATGAEVVRALSGAVRERPDIEVFERHELIDLVHHNDQVAGALALTPSGELIALLAPAVVLATGGLGNLYLRTTNPAEVTGDGLAIAARAGAMLADLEFVQFHPTALDVEHDPVPLLSEALRGEGAVLVNDRGERFMCALHADAELAPRDIVARAIWHERQNGRRAYLDATAAIGREFPQRFPTIYQYAVASGIDPRSEPLPVTPAEHYHMGGVATDASGRSSLPGLWAVGEVAATGLHGANRLASNSLLEGMVFGAIASQSILASARNLTPLRALEVPASALAAPRTRAHADQKAARERVRRIMWEQVGLMRDAEGLSTAIAELCALERQAVALGERNGPFVGRLIATAALKRNESRGAHWRRDHPEPNAARAARSFYVERAAAMAHIDFATRRAA
jgi:L-aspartate oxidase